MSKLGQKEAVIAQVLIHLPTFQVRIDNALSLLSAEQLEKIKASIGVDILSGFIEYSKSLTDTKEVLSYARSMVMNHLKKAKELNGGHSYISSSPSVSSSTSDSTKKKKKEKIVPDGVTIELLPEELQEYAKTLVKP